MSRIHITIAVAVSVFHATVSVSRGDDTLVYEKIVAGFSPHIQSTADGGVDWTGGFITTEGKGIAESMDNQGQLMAKRAATVVAARNALAIAVGINVDSGGRASDVRNGRMMLEGVIKGHEVVEVTWLPESDPPEVRVRLRVPLWGVKSMSSVFRDVHRQRVARSGVQRIALVTERVDVSQSVLVIDARGTGLEPSLFPFVVTDSGGLLHDVSRLAPETAKRQPPARFVESDLTYEELRACVEDGVWLPDQAGPVRARLASYAQAESVAEAQPTTSQPASQPAKKSRRRVRRGRVAVKAVEASGDKKTRIVVTSEDAEKLRRSPEGASLIREGQVVIVVDSAAAGTQGRHERWPGETPVLARSSRR